MKFANCLLFTFCTAILISCATPKERYDIYRGYITEKQYPTLTSSLPPKGTQFVAIDTVKHTSAPYSYGIFEVNGKTCCRDDRNFRMSSDDLYILPGTYTIGYYFQGGHINAPGNSLVDHAGFLSKLPVDSTLVRRSFAFKAGKKYAIRTTDEVVEKYPSYGIEEKHTGRLVIGEVGDLSDREQELIWKSLERHYDFNKFQVGTSLSKLFNNGVIFPMPLSHYEKELQEHGRLIIKKEYARYYAVLEFDKSGILRKWDWDRKESGGLKPLIIYGNDIIEELP